MDLRFRVTHTRMTLALGLLFAFASGGATESRRPVVGQFENEETNYLVGLDVRESRPTTNTLTRDTSVVPPITLAVIS